eukprot:CAMPEP_0115170236 /NCGR_PEP_ID=MMETSP0270-20121206/1678_1 /TAXON_ID=71861 /ORGANISM="Scrippsiella trochoidea, Strain CCMP3099" /LENGTH=135 /DNA_ID=CAMNT_0002582955 /DNA_START=41 /DNA_END=448 /DNA_ORIENTATION=+
MGPVRRRQRGIPAGHERSTALAPVPDDLTTSTASTVLADASSGSGNSSGVAAVGQLRPAGRQPQHAAASADAGSTGGPGGPGAAQHSAARATQRRTNTRAASDAADDHGASASLASAVGVNQLGVPRTPRGRQAG